MSEHIKAELKPITYGCDELASTADSIKKHGFALTGFSGRSMYPMLRYETDKVLVEKATGPFTKYDVVLYPNNHGKYVLHRIIKIKNGEYIIRGDNNLFNEYGITDNEIIGILKGFYHGKKYIDCKKNKGYKLYTFIWTHTFFIQWFYKKCIFPTYRLGIRILSKIKHTIFK
ncbi:MAG: S24/S26 family peptidase [Clostridia bacterium]|nr:S24/S26 family peptidase [Clostridia bacterium]